MKRLLLSGLVLAALTACAPSGPVPATPTPAPAPAASTAPPATPAPPPLAQRPSAPDQCGAREMQYLVGKLRSEIPIPANPALRRVACTTCPVTMDFSPARLNIFFDAETGVIKTVKCG